MTITFFSLKGGVGKSAISFYLSRTYYWKNLEQINYYVQKDIINPKVHSLPAMVSLNYFSTDELQDLHKGLDTNAVNLIDLKTGFNTSHIPLLQASDFIVIPFLTTNIENDILLATLRLLEMYIGGLVKKIVCVPNRYTMNWNRPRTLYHVAMPICTTKTFTTYDFSKPKRHDMNALYTLYKIFF